MQCGLLHKFILDSLRHSILDARRVSVGKLCRAIVPALQSACHTLPLSWASSFHLISWGDGIIIRGCDVYQGLFWRSMLLHGLACMQLCSVALMGMRCRMLGAQWLGAADASCVETWVCGYDDVMGSTSSRVPCDQSASCAPVWLMQSPPHPCE